MRVLHVITGLGVGGAELQLELLLRHTRHDADVITLYNRGPVAEMIEGSGVRVHDVAMGSNIEVWALRRLHRLIRDRRYDVVHTHLYRAQIYGHLAARLAGTPAIVTTEHSIGETQIEGRRLSSGVQALYLVANRWAHLTVAVSEAVRDRLIKRGVPRGKIIVIPNAVDFSRVAFDPVARERVRAQWGITPAAQVIGVLGRLDANKRVDLVLRAVAPLLGDGRVLVVIGDGPQRQRLEKIAGELGVDAHVVFTGERLDIGPVLSSLDILVAAAAQETFGLAILEGLGSGLPVLYTTCPALDGTATDRARQVAGDVITLRRELAVELNRPACPRVPVAALYQRFGIESVTARLDALYERLVRKGPEPERNSPAVRHRDEDLSPLG